MAFDIKFYMNDSENNKIKKSIRETITVTGNLKENSTIINPEVLISTDVLNLLGSNYAFISEFNRYYYVVDVISISNKLCLVKMKVDVLMSFKTEILSNNAIIQKSEHNWNLYLNDGSLKTYQYNSVETIKFPTGFPTGTDLVMAIAGKSNLE